MIIQQTLEREPHWILQHLLHKVYEIVSDVMVVAFGMVTTHEFS